MSDVFAAIGDETRRGILERLRIGGPLSLSDVAKAAGTWIFVREGPGERRTLVRLTGNLGTQVGVVPAGRGKLCVIPGHGRGRVLLERPLEVVLYLEVAPGEVVELTLDDEDVANLPEPSEDQLPTTLRHMGY